MFDSIRMKIAGVVAAVVVVTVAFQLSFFPSRQIDNLTDSLKKKALSLSGMAAHSIVSAFEFEDQAGMNEVLGGLLRDPDAAFAAVFDAQGDRLTAQGEVGHRAIVPPESPLKAPVVEEKAHELWVKVPIPAKATQPGTLVVGFSLASVGRESRSIWSASLLSGLVIAVVGLLIGGLLGGQIASRLSSIVEETERIASGDLSRAKLPEDSNDEIGRLARSFNRMVASQRELVRQIADTALQLNTAAEEFLATAQQQERGATEQSSAVEETRRTLESLLDSGREIANAAQGVLNNAERTQTNSTVMADRIAELSKQVERISEILEVIKGIASKSELLALNAALEGTKAGEAGRGFSLVASQMQKLAENVMSAVRDIRDLTVGIRDATQSSVLATEESTKLTSDTTRSARQIALIIQQQQSGTEQVAAAMDEVTLIAQQTAAASKQIVASSTDMLDLCEQLQSLVNRFSVENAEEV